MNITRYDDICMSDPVIQNAVWGILLCGISMVYSHVGSLQIQTRSSSAKAKAKARQHDKSIHHRVT